MKRPKPTPPANLWDQLAKLREPFAEVPRPDDGFTCNEYAANFVIGKDKARWELEQLVKQGRLKLIPGRGTKASPNYYVWVVTNGRRRER